MISIRRNTNQLCILAHKTLFSLKERLFHASATLSANSFRDEGTHNFLRYNKKIYPPQTENEKPRPAVSQMHLKDT